MKRLRRITEQEVIAEFLKNEFYQEEFHADRAQFEAVVLNGDLTNDDENALRRALLFRRRGPMWRELPPDTQWWEMEFEPGDVNLLRVFPRAQWRRVADGSFYLTDVVARIRDGKFSAKEKPFIAKLQSLSYYLRKHPEEKTTVLLIGIDETRPLTIYEGNHRLTSALLVSPDLLSTRFRVHCAFSPRMDENCWYKTNFANLWRYAKNRFRHLVDKEADVYRVLASRVALPAPAAAEVGATALTQNATEGK